MIQTHVRNAVTLVWGSLRLTLISLWMAMYLRMHPYVLLDLWEGHVGARKTVECGCKKNYSPGDFKVWHSSLSAKVTKNANLGYGHDQGFS